MRLKHRNPVYSSGHYDEGFEVDSTYSASYLGVTTKTAYLLGIITIVAMYFASTLSFAALSINVLMPMIVAPIIAIIMVMITHRNPQIAFFTTTIYAICEGVVLGFVSAIFAYVYGGEIIQMAIVATSGVLFGMLFLYSSGIIRVGGFFRRLMLSMLIGILISSLFLMIASFFIEFTAMYSLYVIIIAVSTVVSALYLLVDFDNISHYIQSGAPREYEWGLALGLVVTLVWLYINLLRLIAIIMDRG